MCINTSVKEIKNLKQIPESFLEAFGFFDENKFIKSFNYTEEELLIELKKKEFQI